MNSFRKYVAEFIGTFSLVLIGCGTAMLVGCNAGKGCGYILTALAFGLVIVGMAYCVGNVSGCHINPAVSLGVLINGGMDAADFFAYVVAQCLGAFAGSATLGWIFDTADITDMTGGFGTNGLGGVNGKTAVGFVVEMLLTFIFVMVILGVTSEKANHGSFGGLIIGCTLTLVHILGIGLTGTSVNPARSLGPALVAKLYNNPDPMKDVWVFIVAPLVGAAFAAFCYKFMEIKPEVKTKAQKNHEKKEAKKAAKAEKAEK